MFRPTYLIYAASLALVGCNISDKDALTHDDSSNPHYKQAQDDLENNNPTGAATDYEAALNADSKLAGAQYELGVIYGDRLGDPIASIYHFKRFLELDPTSPKADEVKGLIDKQSQAFAASLPNQTAQPSADMARLQADNAALKKQSDDAMQTIAQLQAQLGHRHGRLALRTSPRADLNTTPIIPVSTDSATSVPATNTPAEAPRAAAVDTNSPDVNTPATPVVPGATNAPAAASTEPARSYTVVKGDKIWKIAKRMYPGDTKNGVDKILAANPGLDPKKLKIGQVLVIP